MTNKEKLEQLIANVQKLAKLTQSIHETEIYPVSFFSEAFDLTNKIQDDLHEMEVSQIDLFDKQMKEHQAQIFSVVRPRKRTSISATRPVPPPMPTQAPITPPPSAAAPIKKEKVEVNAPIKEPEVEKTVITQPKPISKVEASSAPVHNPTTPVSSNEETHIYKPNDEVPATPSVEKNEISLNDIIEKKKLSDLRKAFTVNDRFLFCRELFNKKEEDMDKAVTELNDKNSYEESLSYLKKNFQWDFENNEIVTEFLKLLEKRFL